MKSSQRKKLPATPGAGYGANPMNNRCIIFALTLCSLGSIIFAGIATSCSGQDEPYRAELNVIAINDSLKQKAHLGKLLEWLPPDRLYDNRGPVSFLDLTFQDWLERTGELPPDFDDLPSIPFLPDPLIIDEGGKNIPVKTMEQWNEKRKWMKLHLEYYITGTMPPKPDNLRSEILSERMDGETLLRMVELTFGPGNKAKLTIELMIPPGEGPFPVFLSQWNHREWAQVAVRRGYIGCVYAGGDWKDDTEAYSELWAGE